MASLCALHFFRKNRFELFSLYEQKHSIICVASGQSAGYWLRSFLCSLMPRSVYLPIYQQAFFEFELLSRLLLRVLGLFKLVLKVTEKYDFRLFKISISEITNQVSLFYKLRRGHFSQNQLFALPRKDKKYKVFTLRLPVFYDKNPIQILI